jgi:hypothetical protein
MLTSYEDSVAAPNDFGNQPVSLSEAKQAILEAASNAKKENIDPNSAQANAVISSFNKRLERAKLESANASKGFATVINDMVTGLDNVQAKYDPNSEANKDKLFTIAELENSHTLGWKNLTNYALGLKKGTGDVAGAGAAAVSNSLYSDRMEMIDSDAIAVDQKREKFKQLEDTYFKDAAALQKQVDSGAMLDIEMQAVLAIKRQEVDAQALTPEDEAILNKVPDSRQNLDSNTTNQQLLDIAAEQRKSAQEIPKSIDDFLAGSKHYNAHESKELSAKIDTEIAPDVEILNQAKDAFKEGNYGEAALEGLPALARVIYKGLYEGIKDPKAALQSISEEFSDIAMARMGVLGMAVSAAESFGIATKMQADGIEDFIKTEGRQPTPEEFNKIAAWSYTAGAMDMASDVIVSGAGKGLGKALKGAPKESIEAIRAKAINQTVEEAATAAQAIAGPGVMGKAAKAAVKTAVGFAENAGMEGITEGAQQIIEDFSSKLKDVGDLKDAANATAMGALVGGGMGPVSSGVEAGAKIAAGTAVLAGAGVVGMGKLAASAVTATKDKIQDLNTPATKGQAEADEMYKGRAANGYDAAVKATVESGDIDQHVDPTKKDTYRPILAVDALAAMNENPDLDLETKASNLQKALAIQEDFALEAEATKIEFEELDRLKKAGSDKLKPADRRLYRELQANIKKDEAYAAEMNTKIQSMNQTESTPEDLTTTINEVKADADVAPALNALKQIFGSKSGGTDTASFGSNLDTLKANPNLTADQKTAVASVQAFQASKAKLTTNLQKDGSSRGDGKTTAEVHNDVLKGGKGFEGISFYNQSISAGLVRGDVNFATTQLQKLSNFAQAHQRKATILRNATDNPKSPEAQAQLAQFNAELKADGKATFKPNPGAALWQRAVSNMEHEADLLAKSVDMARGVFAFHGQAMPAAAPVVKPVPKATPAKAKAPAVKKKAKAPSTADVKQSPVQPTADPVVPTPEVKDAPPVEDEQPPHPADGQAEPVVVNETPVGDTQTDLPLTGEPQTEVKPQPKVEESNGKESQEGQEEGLLSSATMPEWMAGIAKEYHTLLGLKSKVRFYTLKDAVADAANFKHEPNFQISIDGFKKKTLHGSIVSLKDGSFLVITRGTGSKSRIIENIAHELGHALEAETWANLDDETKSAIQAEFDNWRATKPGSLRDFYKSKKALVGAKNAVRKIDLIFGNYDRQFEELAPELQDYLVDFHEWYADQVARWAMSSDKPLTAVDKYFKKIADALRKLYTAVSGKTYLPSAVMQSYLDDLAAANSYVDTEIIDDYQAVIDNPGDYQELNVLKVFTKTDAAKPVAESPVPGNAKVKATYQKFSEQFKQKIQSTFYRFTVKGQRFRYKDPIQYFADEHGQLSEEFKEAVSAVTFKWLATHSKETLFNNDDDIRTLLGLEDGAFISRETRAYMQTIGTNQGYLAVTLGADIFRAMNMRVGKNAPKDLAERIKIAAGLQAIATLENAGYLKSTRVTVAGYNALISNNENTFNSEYEQVNLDGVFYHNIQRKLNGQPQDNEYNKQNTTTFYRVAGEADPENEERFISRPYEAAISKQWREAPHAIDGLLGNEADPREYTFEYKAPSKSYRAPIGDTTQKATIAQTRNKNANDAVGWTESGSTMNAFLFLDQAEQIKMAGEIDPNSEPDEDASSVESTNSSIMRGVEAIHTFLANVMTQPDKRKSVFFVPTKFDANMRMTEQGSIKPQASKIARYLFSRPSWKNEFSLADKGSNDLFMVCLAQSLDIELVKEGTPAAVLEKLNKKLENEDIQTAVAALRELLPILDGKDMLDEAAWLELRKQYPDASAKILAGVKAGEKKVSTLKGLTEYARYLNAQAVDPAGSFTTDISYEIDGMSNGPVLGFVQLATSIDPGLLSILRNAGFIFSDEQGNVAEHLKSPANLDLYQAGGMVWNEAIEALEAEVREKLVDHMEKVKYRDTNWASSLKQQLSRITAAKRVFGEFNDPEGFVAKTLRSLTKDPIMTSGYGKGKLALIKSIAKQLTGDTFKDKLKKIATMYPADHVLTPAEKAEVFAQLNSLQNDMAILANLPKGTAAKHFYLMPKDYIKEGKINSKAILNGKIPPRALAAINDYTTNGHGAAMHTAIESIFGRTKDIRKAFNDGYTINTMMYNVARAHAIQVYKDSHDLPIVLQEKDIKGNVTKTIYADLSKEQYAEIDESLKDIFPTLTTPFKDGVIDMRKDSMIKNYNDEGAIEQQYVSSDRKNPIVRKTEFTKDNGMLINPDVSSIVRAVQMMDATISNMLQGRGLGVLNVHDGFYMGMHQIAAANKAVNEIMYEMLRDYNLAENMYNSVREAFTAFNAYERSMDTGTLEGNEAIDDLWKDVIDKFRFTLPEDVTLAEFIDQTLEDMRIAAEQSKENKKRLLEYVQGLNHYYDIAGGYNVPDAYRVAPKDTDAEFQQELDKSDFYNEKVNIARAKALKALQDANAIETPAVSKEYLQKVRKPGGLSDSWRPDKSNTVSDTSMDLGSASRSIMSSTTPVSNNEADYDPVVEINQGNAVATFDRIHNAGTVQDTDGHANHLRRILFDIVSKVMNPADLFLKYDTNSETAGMLETGGKNRIFLSTQAGPVPASGILAQGIRMSTGEVYVHELVHAVTQYGLKIDQRLKRHVDALYQIAKEKLNVNGEGYKLFLPDGMNAADPANVFEVMAAKDRWNYVFGSKVKVTKTVYNDSATGLQHTREYSHHLDEFMAYGLTNAAFIKALSAIQVDNYKGKIHKLEGWQGVFTGNIQQIMVNVLNRITDMIMHNFMHRAPAANMARELESLAKRLSEVDSKNKTMAASLLQKVDDHSKKLSEFMNGQIKQAFSKLDQKVGATGAVNVVKHYYMNQNSVMGQSLRNYRASIDGLNYGVAQSIGTSIKGLTDRVKGLHQLLNTRRIVIDQARENATMKVKNYLNNLWSRPLEKDEKEALLKAGIKTDLAALYKHFDTADIMAMVDPTATALQTAIANIQKQLDVHPVLKTYSNYFKTQGESLGHIMAQGRALNGTSLPNPSLIAGLYGTKDEGMLTGADLETATSLVDQLASLHALDYTSGDARKTLHALMTEDIQAVEQVIVEHAVLMEDAQEQLFGGNPLKIMKGYTKDITNPRIKVTAAPASSEAELVAQGYIKTSHPIERDIHDPDPTPMFLYINKHGQINDRLSGIFSFTRNHAKGTNLIQNAIKQGLNPLTGASHNARVIHSKKADFDTLLTTQYKPHASGTLVPNHMIPQVDDKGKITKYRYVMSESVKNDVFEKHNSYDDVLGAMAGTVPDKMNTDAINTALITALKAVYDDEYATRNTLYVEISPFTANEAHRQFYQMLPQKAKDDMQRIWGDQRMFVAKDVVDLAFGSKKYSMIEAFAKDPQARNFVERVLVDYSQMFFKDKAITHVKQVEDVLQGLTKIAKNNMIVKSFTTSFNNHVSNLFYCKAKGVSYTNIIKWKREATVGALKYQADMKKLNEYEMQLATNMARKVSPTLSQATIDKNTVGLESRIREMKNEIATNLVVNLMDAGLMQSIVDDVETGGVQSPFPDTVGKWLQDAETKLSATPLGKKAVNVGKVMLLSEDTKGYKALSNAVKMTDFIGRYIMYQHYMQSAPTDEQGYKDAHADAVATVIHEFVNFNLPDHRMVDYGNSIGMIWFSKYAFRVLKPFATMIKERPFEALTAFTLAHTLGMANVAASTLFLGKNPLDLLGNPLSAFLSSSDDAITLQAAEGVMGAVIP